MWVRISQNERCKQLSLESIKSFFHPTIFMESLCQPTIEEDVLLCKVQDVLSAI